MMLWTIQPLHVYEMIQHTGVYRCEPAQSTMMRMEFTEQYDWLAVKMAERIGPPPEDEQKKAYRDWNWERVFDVSSFENGWTRRGDWVQATFWELKKEQIRDVRFFTTGKSKLKERSRRK